MRHIDLMREEGEKIIRELPDEQYPIASLMRDLLLCVSQLETALSHSNHLVVMERARVEHLTKILVDRKAIFPPQYVVEIPIESVNKDSLSAVTLERINALERALRFYADQRNYVDVWDHIYCRGNPVGNDGGKIARVTLEGKR